MLSAQEPATVRYTQHATSITPSEAQPRGGGQPYVLRKPRNPSPRRQIHTKWYTSTCHYTSPEATSTKETFLLYSDDYCQKSRLDNSAFTFNNDVSTYSVLIGVLLDRQSDCMSGLPVPDVRGRRHCGLLPLHSRKETKWLYVWELDTKMYKYTVPTYDTLCRCSA